MCCQQRHPLPCGAGRTLWANPAFRFAAPPGREASAVLSMRLGLGGRATSPGPGHYLTVTSVSCKSCCCQRETLYQNILDAKKAKPWSKWSTFLVYLFLCLQEQQRPVPSRAAGCASGDWARGLGHGSGVRREWSPPRAVSLTQNYFS